MSPKDVDEALIYDDRTEPDQAIRDKADRRRTITTGTDLKAWSHQGIPLVDSSGNLVRDNRRREKDRRVK